MPQSRISPTQDRTDRAALNSLRSTAGPLVARWTCAEPKGSGSPGGFGRLGSRLLASGIHRVAVPAIRPRLTQDLPQVAGAVVWLVVIATVVAKLAWDLGGMWGTR